MKVRTLIWDRAEPSEHGTSVAVQYFALNLGKVSSPPVQTFCLEFPKPTYIKMYIKMKHFLTISNFTTIRASLGQETSIKYYPLI